MWLIDADHPNTKLEITCHGWYDYTNNIDNNIVYVDIVYRSQDTMLIDADRDYPNEKNKYMFLAFVQSNLAKEFAVVLLWVRNSEMFGEFSFGDQQWAGG